MTALVVGSGCAKKLSPEPRAPSPPTKLVLKALYTKEAPKIDGRAGDSVWRKAKETVIATTGGPEVAIKTVYTKDRLYLFASWKDKTKDDIDEVWEFDGAEWKKGPIDDAFAIFWNIDDSVKSFNKKGCQVVCHKGSGDPSTWWMAIEGEATRGSLWKERNQQGDIWDISLGISNVRGEVNDYVFAIDPHYLKYPSTIRPVIFRQHDRFVTRAPLVKNYLIDLADGKEKPKYHLKDGLTVEDTPYPLLDQVEEITDYSHFKAGDRIPYMLFYPPSAKWGGSRDDIKGKGVWKDGKWTIEMERKLDTGHDDDIQFKIPAEGSNYYVFAIAVFDHVIVGHYPSEPVTLEIRNEKWKM